MSTKATKKEKAIRRGAMLGGMSRSEAKVAAVRENGKKGGRPGFRCIVEWRSGVESAWLQLTDPNGEPVVFPSRRAAIAEIERLKSIWEENPDREFRVTRI